MKKIRGMLIGSSLSIANVDASIMREDINVQDYRDFGENLGRYKVGAVNVPVYKKDGTLDSIMTTPLPDFGSVVTQGYATLISPSYIVSVAHNGGYNNVTFGNGAKYATTYKIINRNNSSTLDYHTSRLNKVVTDAAPVQYVTESELKVVAIIIELLMQLIYKLMNWPIY